MENAARAPAKRRQGDVESFARLLILCHPAEGEKAVVGELEPLIGLSQSALSQHLAVLPVSTGADAARRAVDPKALASKEATALMHAAPGSSASAEGNGDAHLAMAAGG
ncbi:MAG: ArsR family transcriptional regulator [Proteobacteria bacterium]|nr:ArsR family transcriptional regulator [Pseudomonadota bacterium]